MAKDPNDKILDILFELKDDMKEVKERLGGMVTRDEFLIHADQVMVILKRLDQERVFTNETIKRLQKQIDLQQKDINHLKRILKVS